MLRGAAELAQLAAYLPLTGGTLTGPLYSTSLIRLNGNGAIGFASGLDPTAGQSVGLGIPAGGIISIDTSVAGNGLGSLRAANITLSGALTVPGAAAAALTSTATFTSGAGAQTGTLTNAPAAGNPTSWIKIVDNGVTRFIPAW